MSERDPSAPSGTNRRQAAALHEALSLRYMYLAQTYAKAAVGDGRELSMGILLTDHGPLRKRYAEILHEWLFESPSSCGDALALAGFAESVTADYAVFATANDAAPMDDETDRHHVVLALRALGRWLNDLDIKECIAELRAKELAEKAA